MIRCIKQILIGIGISLIIFLGGSYTKAQYDENSHELPYDFYLENTSNTIYKDLNFESDGGNWLFREYLSSYRSIFWNNGRLYNYFFTNQNENYQGYFSQVCKIYSETGSLNASYCYNGNGYSVEALNEFYSLTGYNFTRVLAPDRYQFNFYNPVLCFYNSNNKYYYCFSQEFMTGSLAIVKTSDFSEYAGSSIFDFGGSSGSFDDLVGIPLNSEESALNYFESYYGWDESICYVGIDNITSLYGSGSVSFQKGKGLSIFEVFSGLYGSSDINKVYVWLNSWLINYEQWFNRDTPLYLTNYNFGSNQVDLYYDNLTFPFLNNPVALYFMANNIFDYSPYSTMGSTVVSYCNIKINSGSFNDIIDQSDKNNITKFTENYNIGQGLNSDGTVKDYGAWLSSGSSVAFSGNMSIKNSLKNFFDKINENIDVSSGTSTLQILPTWLLSAFIFVVLFKFLRKR